MYKIDPRTWNFRVRRAVIVSLIAPLLSILPQAPIASAAPACVLGTDYTLVSAAGAATAVYRFTNTGAECTFNLPTGLTTGALLAVGAGGGGGPDGGAGGGGGELRYNASQSFVGVSSIDIWVGTGGNGGVWGGSASASGTSTTVKWNGSTQYQANGGARADGWSSNGPPGGAGGSGGIGGNANTNGQQGGSGPSQVCTTGLSPTGTVPSNSITGSSVNYGGGGGGGMGNNSQNGGTAYLGAAGGGTSGGRGANYKLATDGVTAINGASNGSPGTANTGGGGGGGSACDARGPWGTGLDGVSQRTAGGRGANGVVILSFSRITQTITFGSIANRRVTAGTVTVAPTSSSGLAVALTSATTSVCTVSGFVITPVSAGTCTINANQAGDNNYAPATQVQQSFTISPNFVSYNSNNATSTRPIESTTASTLTGTTLSSGRLAKGQPISSGLTLNLDAADPSTVSASTWSDKSGNSNNATLVGSPTYDSADGSFRLNGTSQYFNLGSSAFSYSGTQKFTLNIMFKSETPMQYDCLICRYATGSNRSFMLLNDSQKIRVHREVSPWNVLGSTTYDPGLINYASFVYNGTTMIGYVNGIEVARQASGTEAASTTETFIGAGKSSGSATDFFTGKIYSVQIYSRDLSQSEITQNYQALLPNDVVKKSNFSLGPWTTAVDTGTSYGTVSYDLSALPTPYFRVSAENYSGGTLSASVGGSQLSITKTGSPVLNSNSGGGYGANARFATISGGTGDGFRLGNTEISSYTFCGMARYKDFDSGVKGTQGRIFAHGSGTNWISGWYAGGVKNFFHNEWLNTYTTVVDQQWHVVCDSGNEIYWDGVKQSVTPRAYTSLPPLAINWAGTGDNSTYEFTEAIAYDQALSAAQIGMIFRYFENKFGLTGITTSSLSASSLTPPTNYPNNGDSTLNASWFSLITYDGNKQTSGTAPASHAITNLGGTAATAGTLARTGYRFIGWNTAANGSGTQYAAGAQLANTGNLLLYAQWALPVSFPVAANNPSALSPYMRLVASDYDAANKIWRDSSGNSRNVTRIVGTPSLTTSTGNGSSKTIQVIAGGINDKIYFDNAPISTNWTVFALSRYSGASNRNRIISGNYSAGAYQDSNGNWLIGQWAGQAAVGHFNGWIGGNSASPAGLTVTDWVMSTGFPYNYRYNGISRGTSGGTAELPPLGINTISTEVSDYQVAEVIIYDRTLTANEIVQVEDYFDEMYGLSYPKIGTYPTASTLVIGTGIGGRSDTFTAADGLGNKTFTLSPVVSGISIDTSTANGVALVVGQFVPTGTYVETITATDQAGLTAQHVVTINVSPAVKFDTTTATSITTTSGRAAQLRLNTVNGVGTKIFTMTQTSVATSSLITLDTSTAASGLATLRVDSFTAPGNYTASIVVTDSTKLRSTYTITITVNAPPTLVSSGPLATAPVLNDLRLHLDAGDTDSYSGSGSTWNDLSGNARNGTLQSSPTFSKDFGGVLNFDGTAAFVTVPSVRSEVFTVEAWVKFNALNNNYACVVSNVYAGDKLNYAICFWGNSTIRAGYHQAGTGWVSGQTGAFTPVVGTWYQLVYKVEKVGSNYIGSLYQNGNLVAGQTTSTIAPSNDQFVDRIGRRWDNAEYINGTIPIVRIYSRALTDSEITQNYNATSPRFLNSPTNSVSLSTTQGVATSTSLYYAGLGTGTKSFTISPSVPGVTLDTSTVNTVKVNYSNTLQSTDSATARVITQTVTAFDSVGQVATTPVYVSATINPPIVITAAIPTTLSTTFGVAAYDTFTATRGMGGPYTFTVTSSAYQSAFTMSKPSANVGLLTVANNLPAGTYYETITATDSSTASTTYLLTVIVNPGMTLTAVGSSTLTTTITRSASMRVNIANGTGAKTLNLSSPAAGITLDSSTVGSGFVTINVGTSVPANTYNISLTVRDVTGSTTTGTFSIVVNEWPQIGPPAIVSSNLRLNLDAGDRTSYSGSGTTWTDISGNSKNGTWQSSPIFSTNSGGLLTIGNTTSQYLSTSVFPVLTTFTAEVWVKFNAIPTGDNCILTDRYSATGINMSICFNNAQRVVGGYWFNNVWTQTTATAIPSTNTWYHFAYTVTLSGSTYTSILYQNGSAVGASVTSSTAPRSGNTSFLVGTNWNANTSVVSGEIAVVRIYDRGLTAAEVIQNYNAQGNRFFATNSGTAQITTTEGLNRTISGVAAVEGSGTKTFTISPTIPGITLNTATPNQYDLNIASTLAATDSSTARTYLETVTATDSTTASTTLAYTIVVNPPVRLTVTTDTVTTTSGIAAFDTFTAVTGTGTGNKTFTLTGSPTTSGFTLTQANNVAVLKVEPTANPGTYFETVTATDSLGATTSKMVRVVVAPGPTLTGSSNLVSARGIAFISPAYSVANGITPYTYTLTSRAVSPDTNTVTGITFDTATMTLRVSAAVASGTYLETITVRDVNGATSNYLINLEVKPPVVLSGSMSITKTYGDLTVSNYTTSSGIAPFTFTTSTPTVTNVCVPMTGTYIGDGTNGTLGVSYTFQKIVGTERCSWIAPNGVTSVDYAVVGGGGGGGNGRGGGGGGGGVALGTALSVNAGSVYDIAVAVGGSATNDGNDSWIRSSDLSTTFVYAAGGGAGGSMAADLPTITGNDGRSVSPTGRTAGGSGGGGGNNFHDFSGAGTSWTGNPGAGGTGATAGFSGGGSYRCSTSANSQDGNTNVGGNGGRTTGGGGGAGGAGVGYSGSCPTYSAAQAPNGGAGLVSRLTGSAETYGGGGGGSDGRTEATSEAVYRSSGRGLGNGGGGNGQTYRQADGTLLATPLAATSGDYNTGGGGGGGIASAGSGGSGVVVLRYVTPVADSQTVTMYTVSNGVASAGSVTLTIPENTPVGSITSKTIRVVQTGGVTTDYTINVTINKATPTVALSLPGSVTTAQYGTPVTISAATSTAGNVLFKYGNTNITACTAVATSAGVASCSWTPNALGATTLKATLTPTDSTNYNNSNEATFSVTVGKADTLTVTASSESLTFTGSTSLVSKPFTQTGLVAIDSLTAVSMLYSGTANDGTSYSSSTAPTKAGTYLITPDTSTVGISTISGNYLSVLVATGTLTINRAPNTSSLVYPTINTNSAVTSPPSTNYITFRTGATDTPTTRSRLGNGVITYSTTTSTNCSVDSSTAVMTVLQAGSCVVRMLVAQGDNYLADSATATIQIAKGNRTISLSSTTSTLKFTETATVTTSISDGSLDGVITYSLNSSPGCSFDGLGGILLATSGTLACTLNATIAEGTNFLTASTASALPLTIAKANAPLITIDTVTAVDYALGARVAISPTYRVTGFKGTDAAASLTLTYSFVSNPFETFSYSDTRTPMDAGTYRITPSALVMSSGLDTNYETPNYSAAAINFTVNRIAQDPITIDGVNGEVSVPFTLVYRGGSNPTATPTFTKVSGSACTVTGNALNATAAGICVVTVTVPANRNYLAITSDSITVRVRSYSLTPVFVFGNGTTGISIATNTPLKLGSISCTTGCTPTITSINPYSGSEGDIIVLTGSNFTGATRVIFNVFTNASVFNVDSDTQISVQIPVGLPVGDGTIEVVTPGGVTPRWFDFGIDP